MFGNSILLARWRARRRASSSGSSAGRGLANMHRTARGLGWRSRRRVERHDGEIELVPAGADGTGCSALVSVPADVFPATQTACRTRLCTGWSRDDWLKADHCATGSRLPIVQSPSDSKEAPRQKEAKQNHDSSSPVRPPWLRSLQPRHRIERDPNGAHHGEVCCRLRDGVLHHERHDRGQREAQEHDMKATPSAWPPRSGRGIVYFSRHRSDSPPPEVRRAARADFQVVRVPSAGLRSQWTAPVLPRPARRSIGS